MEMTASGSGNGDFFKLLGRMNQDHFDSFKNSLDLHAQEPVFMSVKDTTDALRLKFV